MKRNLAEAVGFHATKDLLHTRDKQLFEYVNLKLAARGYPIYGDVGDYPIIEMSEPLLANYREKHALLSSYLCPVDRRIQEFLADYLSEIPDCHGAPLVPTDSLGLDRHGQARVLSLPPDQDHFQSDIMESWRVANGVCHNPLHDRRTTKGVFHIVEGGLPVPGDKKEVPKVAFAGLLMAALNPPETSLELPFTANQDQKARLFVSLLLRPVICPEVPGYCTAKSMEIRFFAPGSMVANLDFVESIFGNVGDPLLFENDAALDVVHWSGHTGCVILAPHLCRLKKKDLGLPHVKDATERQKRDGMCWSDEDEVYNDGTAFKICCRDHRGVMVTLIADNYFGYCKKEVKTQISYAANLYGQIEEEHAGGALAFPSFDLGDDFHLADFYKGVQHTYAGFLKEYGALLDVRPDGYARDKRYADILYVHEDARFNLRSQSITWTEDGRERSIKLLPNRTYVYPTGYKVQMVNPRTGQRWRLIGTTPDGIFCHKPCTVSGGGKSEISKSIADAMLSGRNIIQDFQKDFDQVETLVQKDYGGRYHDGPRKEGPSRPVLSTERSLGSVIRLFTPSPDYTDEYNDWLHTVPSRIRDLVLTVKRFYKPKMKDDWRSRFTVDTINGEAGHELKYKKDYVVSRYLRVGFNQDGSWRTFSLRKDFWAAAKVQMEDDISCSVVAPASALDYLRSGRDRFAHKFVHNCEYRLFQRPDEAVIRGYDKTTEQHFSEGEKFFSNYQPCDRKQVREMIEDSIGFEQFTEPMQRALRMFVDGEKPDYFTCTAIPRLLADGAYTKNPRYLQTRPDLEDPRSAYLAQMGIRMSRQIPPEHGVPIPVGAVLTGRRNNPPDPKAGIRPLAVYNPIHYQELPELFMEFIASLTGKSPSTTGAGSEGALTKGPFNALLPIVDLNNALVSYILTAQPVFSTAAGYVGHKYRVDHDISLLMPEIWCRMRGYEQDPRWMIEQGYLEKCDDFEYEGKPVLASRLGYRITLRFVNFIFGRVFSNPESVFDEEMLQPELQSMEYFADGIDNIVSTQERVARLYLEDGSMDLACPPLRALLHIMVHGHYEGLGIDAPEIRTLFTQETLLSSDWYRARLDARVEVQRRSNLRKVASLQSFKNHRVSVDASERLQVNEKIREIQQVLEQIDEPGYRDTLMGTLGADPAVLG